MKMGSGHGKENYDYYLNPPYNEIPLRWGYMTDDILRKIISTKGFSSLKAYEDLLIYILFGYKTVSVHRVFRPQKEKLFQFFESYGTPGYNYLSHLFSYTPCGHQIKTIDSDYGKESASSIFYTWWLDHGGWDILDECVKTCSSDTNILHTLKTKIELQH